MFGIFGLLLFSFVGYLILGYGKDQYIGLSSNQQPPTQTPLQPIPPTQPQSSMQPPVSADPSVQAQQNLASQNFQPVVSSAPQQPVSQPTAQ